ncbi:hypothetical protein BDB00DRAFT_563671 [Zychaea mexicana]|uniref:uncharacterized protein n=1 Tax=Zychaea mexicana TaxID=64656 RepID=UPI0022FF363B|nr:uncharacterized protein BDB00DRAFT_563671 [Zychaea mexicana]KAI9490236.1 hypothetical protein BDB00DRAFT_563671 [Zychaea mexicana]
MSPPERAMENKVLALISLAKRRTPILLPACILCSYPPSFFLFFPFIASSGPPHTHTTFLFSLKPANNSRARFFGLTLIIVSFHILFFHLSFKS